MKLSLLRTLACPECETPFTIEVFKAATDVNLEEIEDGILTCERNHSYIITGFIPRMLPNMLIEFPEFSEKYKSRFLSKKIVEKTTYNKFENLQRKTKASFGFEWQIWNRFGWDKGVSLQQTRDIFNYKVLASKEELAGKLVLDAGCGNGRYTNIAREYGGEVIGIDLSRAVDEAFKNLKGERKIHFVQGDLFKLPFKKETFDFIFSNGVLMHTGNARLAFHSLVSRLSKNGTITIHLYHRGNPIYEFNDWWLRLITTHLPLSVVYQFSKLLAGIAYFLPKKFVIYGLNSLFRIEPHAHYVFDWYTAPIATHHTYKEVYDWVREEKLNLVADHNKTKYPWRRLVFPFQFLTVKASRNKPEHEPFHTTS